MNDVRVIITNFPNQQKAREISKRLVEQHLAACVNLLPTMESIYHWQGEVHHEGEVMAWFKTTASGSAALVQALKEAHPYEVPEILQFQPEQVHPAYAAWVKEQTTPRL